MEIDLYVINLICILPITIVKSCQKVQLLIVKLCHRNNFENLGILAFFMLKLFFGIIYIAKFETRQFFMCGSFNSMTSSFLYLCYPFLFRELINLCKLNLIFT